MSYDTLYFALFLAVTWAAFDVLPWRGQVLLVASIVFYAVAGLRDSLVAASHSRQLRFPVSDHARSALALSGARSQYRLSCLFQISRVSRDRRRLRRVRPALVIPLGISFYIFQLTAFLIDLSRGRAKPFYSLPRFALFKLFFGQLVAGPIMRWRQFGPQIHRLFDGTLPRRRLLGIALGLCLVGLIKKVVFADALAPFVETIFHNGPASAAAAWLGIFLFSSQVYFDFSGYSDIALGFGYLFGLRLAVNFRQPFTALTPQDFWRRWHITLSFWIRDYLFTPLALLQSARGVAGRLRSSSPWRWPGSGTVQTGRSSSGAWAGRWPCCLWHMANRFLIRLGAAQWVLTFGIWLVLLVFFRSSDVGAALRYIATMFGGSSAGTAPLPDDGAGGALIALGCAGLLALHWSEGYLHTRQTVLLMRRFDGLLLRALFAGLALWLLLLPKVQDNPFIYFRF